MKNTIISFIIMYITGVIATAMLFQMECVGIYTEKRKKSRRYKNNIDVLFTVSVHDL